MAFYKPLGRKAYGSIPHLRGSRVGSGDHYIRGGVQDILTKSCRGRRIIVQEKLDGSNVAVAKVDGSLFPLNRKGWPAISSPHVNHHLFHWWAMDHAEDFDSVLLDGEWIVGEWLAQATGTLYDLSEFGPFAVFDLFSGGDRVTYHDLIDRIGDKFRVPNCLHDAEAACSVDRALSAHEIACVPSDGIEGLVYRAESDEKVEFLAKFVRCGKVDGKYLEEVSGKPAIWNWRPESDGALCSN